MNLQGIEMDIVDTLELLYENAKANATTAQGQHLTLAYSASLLRHRTERLMRWQDEVDEIRIALVGRAKPIFGFIDMNKEEKIREVQSVKRVDVALRGSVATGLALLGEIQCHL
jgi:hypothetical protein